MSLIASLWFDRDPEFSLILDISVLKIIINNPYKYNHKECVRFKNLINDNKNCEMYFDDVILKIQNDIFTIIKEDKIYDLIFDKSVIIDCFDIIINSKAIHRYQYWTNTKSLVI